MCAANIAGSGNELPADAVVLADPGLVVAEPVELLDQRCIPLEGQRRVLARLVDGARKMPNFIRRGRKPIVPLARSLPRRRGRAAPSAGPCAAYAARAASRPPSPAIRRCRRRRLAEPARPAARDSRLEQHRARSRRVHLDLVEDGAARRVPRPLGEIGRAQPRQRSTADARGPALDRRPTLLPDCGLIGLARIDLQQPVLREPRSVAARVLGVPRVGVAPQPPRGSRAALARAPATACLRGGDDTAPRRGGRIVDRAALVAT